MTLAGLTWKGLVRSRLPWGLLLAVVAVAGAGLLARSLGASPREVSDTAGDLVGGIVVPVVVLLVVLVGLATELRDRSVLLLLATPVSRIRFLGVKLAVLGVAGVAAGLALAGAFVLAAGNAADPDRIVVAAAAAGGIASLAATLCVVRTTHPVTWFLVLVVLADLVAAALPPGGGVISVVRWADSVGRLLTGHPAVGPGGPTALLLVGVLLGLTFVAGTHRLRHVPLRVED